jgi:L-fucose mutarotase
VPTRDRSDVLDFPIIHPPLVAAIAAAGHGSRILVADGNYPVTTATNPLADRVFLNVARGLVDAPTIVELLAATVPLESATLMETAGGAADDEPPIWSQFRRILAGNQRTIEFGRLPRDEFYAACRGPDLALVVATGETAPYANVLLTVGVAALAAVGRGT